MKRFFLIGAFIFAAVAFVIADEIPPELTINDEGCGRYTILVHEVGEGVYHLPNVNQSKSQNFSSLTMSQNFVENEPNFDFSFTCYVLDPYLPANIEFYLYDTKSQKDGNPVAKNIKYKISALLFSPNTIDLNNIVLYSEITTPLEISIDSSEIIIESISLKHTSNFEIANPLENPILVSPSKPHTILLNYKATEMISMDYDTILITTSCENIEYSLPISASVINPEIRVSDIDFGVIEYGKTHYISDILPKQKLLISNFSEDSLSIYGSYFLSNKYFSLSKQENKLIQAGLKIAPIRDLEFTSLRINANANGEIHDTLVFSNNANGVDSIAILSAYVINKGVYLESAEFGTKRLNANEQTKTISIKNNSTEPLIIESILLEGDTEYIYPLTDEITPPLYSEQILHPENSDGDLLKEIIVPIKCKPSKEGNWETKIYVNYRHFDGGKDSLLVYNSYKLRCIQPKFQAVGYDFQKPIAIGDTSAYGNIIIENRNSEVPLSVHHISNDNPANQMINSFIFDTFPEDTTILPGKSIVIPVKFAPQNAGQYKVDLQIRTNAYYLPTNMLFGDTLISITANGYLKPIETDWVTFPTVSKCGTQIDSIRLSNISDDAVLIDSIRIYGDNRYVFELFEKTDNIIIPAYSTDYIDIAYLPLHDSNTTTNAPVEIFFNNTQKKLYLSASNYINHIKLELDTLYNLEPGVILSPRNGLQSYSIKVKLDGQNNEATKLSRLTIVLKFSREQIRYLDEIFDYGLATSASTVAKLENIDNKYSKLIITIEDLNAFPDEFFILPVFELLLSNNIVTIEALSAHTSLPCYDFSANTGVVTYEICNFGLNSIVHINENLRIISVQPNPVVGRTATIIFTVPFDLPATIDMISANGIVTTIFDSDLITGEHSFQADLGEFNPGVYTIRLTQSNFSTSTKCVIYR